MRAPAKINGVGVDWTAGAMLFETNVLPYKLEVANGLQWRTSFILLACAFVAALILGAVLHDKQARHWAEKLERTSCNSYDPAAGQLDPAFSEPGTRSSVKCALNQRRMSAGAGAGRSASGVNVGDASAFGDSVDASSNPLLPRVHRQVQCNTGTSAQAASATATSYGSINV